MAHVKRYFFLVCLLLATVQVIFAASTRARSKKKTKDSKEKEVNVCDLDRRNTPMFCYCDNNQIRNASDVNCWIFDNVDVNDPIWEHFSSQLYLEKLTFIIRHGGTYGSIPTTVLGQMKNLQKIGFQYASIHELASHAFSNLPTVVEINLSRNMIVILRKYAIENMKNLTVINFDENRIAEINRDVFVNLPNLKQLFLNRNNVSILHDKAFKDLGSLQELELNGNQLSVLTTETFYGLRNLIRLDLRSNLLSMIGDKTFLELPELRSLELDQNQIEYISEKALDGMRNLKKLCLSENKLVSLEPDFLSGAPGINFLDLRENALKTMTFDNIKPIVTNLYNVSSHLYLDGNNLICDCRLAWIWGLKNETKNLKLKDVLDELTCFLESNNATTVDQDAVKGLNIPQNEAEYAADNLKDRDTEDDAYMGDDGNYYEEYEEGYGYPSRPEGNQTKVEIVEGKAGYMKHLFDLKPEELPCPEPSREDLMASEQPSSHRENSKAGSFSIFSLSHADRTDRNLSILILTAILPIVLFT
ncbi:connectin [Cephus cinctus]|uniref:Connectin n=1 Tax=Cephus cinctus TaxID=211228 RepID=A0AAJ7FIZ7_CEPCN|nr:connectin [Cephus cinctus]XP_015594126.1 connectin [Cephus cinctus]XP_024940136.1 connectin [Cephus cinctus]